MIKLAIQKAIEGGYEKGQLFLDNPLMILYREIVLDPKFWEALGRSLGWTERYHRRKQLMANIQVDYTVSRSPENFSVEAWQNAWHEFIDHLAENKDPESFFSELLK